MMNLESSGPAQAWPRPVLCRLVGTALALIALLVPFGVRAATFTDDFSSGFTTGTVVSRTLGGQSFTFTFVGSGDLAWDNMSFPGNPGMSLQSSDFDPAVESVVIKRADGAEFVLQGLTVDVTEGAAVTVQPYRDGAPVGAPATVAPFTSTGLSFQGIVVDELQVSSTDFFFTLLDDFSGDTTLPAPPTVTDASIGISGATGIGGAYRIGDTVTAIWNNTSGGDNNSGVSGVTVDFSRFGGGTAVVATNSGGSWTATYTIVSGAIDASNRNISVMATNAVGTTTTADTTNATVDNVAPRVTGGSISVSGGTGTGGAFRIGDTVTATWDNTASGDNNLDTLSAVSVNFSQFGGGNAVVATNSSGTWTATYTLTAGAIEASDRNIAVTATDNAGNAATAADATNATVDTRAPSVSSITVAGTPAATDPAVAFAVAFSEPVTGVSVDDFTLATTGSAMGVIESVSMSGGATATVSVTGITGDGSMKVKFNGSTNVFDVAGNGPPAAFTGGSSHTVAIPTTPDAPTIGTAIAGDAEAVISFTAPVDDGGSAITQYTVTSSPGNVVATGAASPIVVSGLANGTAYTFTVTATSSAGTSVASAASNSVTPRRNQSITFANPGTQNFGTSPTLVATSTHGLAVVFSSSTAGVCTVTSGGTLTFATAGTCTIDADQPGDAATNAATTVSRSFTVAAVVPGAPMVATATAADGQASVAFSPPASNGGSAITGYTATANPGGFTGTGTGSPITVAGLTNGVTYTFTVTATNAAGTGAASAATNPVTPAAVQTITFANPGAQQYGTTPTLAASSDSGLPVSFTSSTTGVCTITSGGSLSFVTAGVCTINADQAGNSTYLPASQVSRSFTVNPVVAGAPVAVVATAGDTRASIAFSAPGDTGGVPITGYTVTTSPAHVAPVTGAGSPILVTGLTNGQAYTFTVTADNVAGTGPASTASNVVTPVAGQSITFDDPGAQNFGTTPTLVATADSGLAVVFTTATPAVCDINSGGVLTAVATGTCTINADQPGDASISAALQVSRSFQINAVAPGAPVIGTATRAGAGAVDVAFTAPAFEGGADITSYTVTSAPGGISATASGSPITVTGLAAGTSYTFTVVATNTAGSGSASAPSNAAVPAPQLLAVDSELSVAYGATATDVALDIDGTPSSVAIITAPAHGTAVVDGITISYQPAVGYSGIDTFTYSASNAYSTTAPAAVTVTVAPATVVLGRANPADTTGGSAYSHRFTASGGAAPYAFRLASGTLPEGLTLETVGTLSGTPTEAGDFTFEVGVTDSSTGAGPFSARQAYAMTVATPEITFQASLAEFTFGSEVSQSIEVTGGAAPYDFSVVGGAIPHGLSLSNTGQLSGTPEAAGPFEFTVQVQDANGFIAQQAFELVVAQAAQSISGFAANPAAPVFSPGGTFALSAEGGASGNAVVFATGTPGICTVAGSTVTMRAAGRCSLTADQAGSAGFQAAPQLMLEVDIAAAVPELVWPDQVSKVLGESAFQLDNPDSPSAGAFTFASSQPDVATVSGRTVTLVGVGTTVITASQAADGNYAAASIEMQLVVVDRPDPTRDAGVTGLLQAQVDASVRFATTQQANIRDRLRQVRSGANASSSQLTLAYAGGEDAQGVSMPLGQATKALWPSMPQGWGAWLAGTATFGSSGRGTKYDFDSDGITLGLDRNVGDHLLVGIAGSLANNDSELSVNAASQMQADQRSLALYGLWRAGEHLFVDAVAATGQLDFDLQRWSDDAGAVGTATREGEQWFASVSVGYEHRGASMNLTGYGRLDTSRTTLDSYREHGLDIYDLAYRKQEVENSTAAIGIEGSWILGEAHGIRPFWSVEYRQALEDKGNARMNYVLVPGATDYRLRMGSFNDDALSLSTGLEFKPRSGWLVSLLLGHEQASNATESTSIGLRVSYGGQAAVSPALPAGDGATGDSTVPGECRGGRCRTQDSR